jgi:autoinducer 2 (AI-2) kinase
MGFDVLKPEQSGKAACIRAIEENAAYTSRGHLDILREISGYEPKEAVFCGGSSKGTLWPHIMADVLGLAMKIPVVKEATSLGSLICASVALGSYPTFGEAAAELVSWERVVEPESDNVSAYEEHYLRWKDVYKHALSIVDAGLLKSMWQAPGT